MEHPGLHQRPHGLLSSADPGCQSLTTGSCNSLIVRNYNPPGVHSDNPGPNPVGQGLTPTGIPSYYYFPRNQIICIPTVKKEQVPVSPKKTVLDTPEKSSQKKTLAMKAIKKPPNSFMLFMRENRSRVAADLKINNSSVVCKVLGQMWWSLPNVQKEEYYQRALMERRMHEEKYPDWGKRELVKKGKKKVKGQHRDSYSDSEKFMTSVSSPEDLPGATPLPSFTNVFRPVHPDTTTKHKAVLLNPETSAPPKPPEPFDLSCLSSFNVDIDIDPRSLPAELPDLNQLFPEYLEEILRC